MGNLKNTLELMAAINPIAPSIRPIGRPSMPTPGGGMTSRPISTPIKPISPIRAKKFSRKTRKKMAKKGTAEPDGSYPINSPKDVSNAVKDFHRSSGSPKDKAHIQKRAKALGLKDPFAAEAKIAASASISSAVAFATLSVGG